MDASSGGAVGAVHVALDKHVFQARYCLYNESSCYQAFAHTLKGNTSYV